MSNTSPWFPHLILHRIRMQGIPVNCSRVRCILVPNSVDQSGPTSCFTWGPTPKFYLVRRIKSVPIAISRMAPFCGKA